MGHESAVAAPNEPSGRHSPASGSARTVPALPAASVRTRVVTQHQNVAGPPRTRSATMADPLAAARCNSTTLRNPSYRPERDSGVDPDGSCYILGERFQGLPVARANSMRRASLNSAPLTTPLPGTEKMPPITYALFTNDREHHRRRTTVHQRVLVGGQTHVEFHSLHHLSQWLRSVATETQVAA